jgi:hypothetical protein
MGDPFDLTMTCGVLIVGFRVVLGVGMAVVRFVQRALDEIVTPP